MDSEKEAKQLVESIMEARSKLEELLERFYEFMGRKREEQSSQAVKLALLRTELAVMGSVASIISLCIDTYKQNLKSPKE